MDYRFEDELMQDLFEGGEPEGEDLGLLPLPPPRVRAPTSWDLMPELPEANTVAQRVSLPSINIQSRSNANNQRIKNENMARLNGRASWAELTELGRVPGHIERLFWNERRYRQTLEARLNEGLESQQTQLPPELDFGEDLGNGGDQGDVADLLPASVSQGDELEFSVRLHLLLKGCAILTIVKAGYRRD